MKAVSTIVTVVLLLMITVGLVAVLFVWLSGMLSTITRESGETVEHNIKSLTTSITIESAVFDGTSFKAYVSNSGREDIDMSTAAAFVEGVYQEIASGNSGILRPGERTTLVINNNTDVCGKILRISVYPQSDAFITVRCV